MRKVLAGLLALLPLSAAAEGYAYIPGLHRDPFAAPTEAPPPEGRCEEALCRVELDQVKVTGIVTGQAKPLAMIEDPASGEAFVVRAGAHIGKHNGRITRIAADRVVVSEVIYAGSEPRVIERELRINAEK